MCKASTLIYYTIAPTHRQGLISSFTTHNLVNFSQDVLQTSPIRLLLVFLILGVYTQELLLACPQELLLGLWEQYGMLGISSRFATCKARALSTILSIIQHILGFLFIFYNVLPQGVSYTTREIINFPPVTAFSMDWDLI